MAKIEEEECCPRFDPAAWDGKTIEWKDKLFVRARIFTLMYIPINMGGVMRRTDAMIRKAGGQFIDGMTLSEHVTPWTMWQYLAVDKPLPELQTTTLSGNFWARVYEGPYEQTGNWMKDFESGLRAIGKTAVRTFMWYTTCPKCAKKYGKNYVAVLGQLT